MQRLPKLRYKINAALDMSYSTKFYSLQFCWILFIKFLISFTNSTVTRNANQLIKTEQKIRKVFVPKKKNFDTTIKWLH